MSNIPTLEDYQNAYENTQEGVDWQKLGTATNDVVDFLTGVFGRTEQQPIPEVEKENNTVFYVVVSIVVLVLISVIIYAIWKKR